MSTVVIPAWRLRLSQLSDFLEEARAFGLDQVADRFISRMPRVKDDLVGDHCAEDASARAREVYDHQRRFDLMFLMYETMAKYAPDEQDLRDVQEALDVWVDSKFAYVVPAFGFSVFKDWEPPEYAEEYEYYNHTDPPEDVSPRRWHLREKKWNHLFKDQQTGQYDARVKAMRFPIVDLEQTDVGMTQIRLWTKVRDKLGIASGEDSILTTFKERRERKRALEQALNLRDLAGPWELVSRYLK